MSIKKELKYSTFEEFMRSTEFDFSNCNFENPKICNTLLKMHDQGKSFLSKGDEEAAFQLLFRFFEGNMELRRSKLYLKDKSYIEKFISNEKLAKTMENLEILKKNIKIRYEEREKINSSIIQIDQLSEMKNNKKKHEDEALSSPIKTFLSPKELNDLIKNTNQKILLIDTREKNEFDNSHMNLNIMLTDEKKKKNTISYINIPSSLIENVTWNITESLKKYDKTNVLNRNQSVEQAFSSRAEYDFILMFDQNSSLNDFRIDSKLSILKKAIYDYEINQKLKNEPIILDGGWNEWIVYYPGFVTNSDSIIMNGQKSVKNSQKIEESFKKSLNFDYPDIELNDDSKKLQLENNTNTSNVKLINTPVNINNSSNQEKKKEENKFPEIESNSELNRTKNMLKTLPNVDRSSKPGFFQAQQNIDINLNKNIQSININNGNIKTDDLEKPNKDAQSNKNFNSFYEKSDVGNNEFSKKNSSIQNSLNDSNLNGKIFDAVYAPNRFNKSFHTPYMKDGSTKILNKETGLFSYYPSSSQTSSPSIIGQTNSENLNKKKDVPLIPSKIQPVPPVLGPKPIFNKENKPQSNSNLKRTISSPNIANLDEDVQIDQSSIDNENSFSKQNKITKPNSLSTNPTLDIPKTSNKINNSNKNSNLIPNINRNSKPMSDYLFRSRFEELDPVFGNVHPGLTGIRNLGNTCFMNSIIQCLSMTENLVHYFTNGHYKKDLNRTNELGFRGEIADEFLIIIQSMWGGHCRIISPKRFKSIIGQFNEQFVTNEQQDAQELLLFLLDGLHEDLNRVITRPKFNEKEDDNELLDTEAAVKAWNIHLSINNSIIVDLFQGQFKSTVVCSTCKTKSVKFDAFMYLTLPLPSVKCDLFQCLELFLKPEIMSGESKWKCPKCKQYRDAIKKIDIWKLPQLLIIHLKRFKYHGLWRDKIVTNVDYPISNLNMDKFITNSSNKQIHNYQLYATTNHTGTLDGGHYTAMCRHPKLKKWFKFDDTSVKEINDLSSLKSASSYILFYTLNSIHI